MSDKTLKAQKLDILNVAERIVTERTVDELLHRCLAPRGAHAAIDGTMLMNLLPHAATELEKSLRVIQAARVAVLGGAPTGEPIAEPASMSVTVSHEPGCESWQPGGACSCLPYSRED